MVSLWRGRAEGRKGREEEERELLYVGEEETGGGGGDGGEWSGREEMERGVERTAVEVGGGCGLELLCSPHQ